MLLSCQQTVVPLGADQYLQPQFWRSFSQSKGCQEVSLYAWNSEETLGLEVTALNTPSFEGTRDIVYDLAKRDAVVLVETGSQIPENFCVKQIKQIPVAQVYEGVSGMIRMHLVVKGDIRQASATFENVIVIEPKSKKQIVINNLKLGPLDLLPRDD